MKSRTAGRYWSECPPDDLEALTWLRSQPEGRVAVNAAN